MLAAMNGHIVCVKNLLKRGAGLEIRSSSGYTALLYAVRFSRSDVLRVLIENGADVNVVTGAPRRDPSPRMTPLHYAAYNNDENCVRQLVKAGGDITILVTAISLLVCILTT